MTGKFYIKNECKDLVDPQTRKKIFRTVVIVHVFIISLILVWGFVIEWFKPEPRKIITVSLYSPPEKSPATAYTPPDPQPKEKPLDPVKKTPPEKKAYKKPVKKTPVKKKPVKKWKPAKKIKVSKDIVYVKPKKTSRQFKPVSKQELLKYLNQNRVKIRSNSKSSGSLQSYENSVGAYLYQLWETPDKSVLGGRRPEVKIQLNIAANGKLLSARVLRTSGIAAMDQSVKKLLSKAKFLPAPTNGACQITLILEVIE